jgi:SAM-dependent methyltransferase
MIDGMNSQASNYREINREAYDTLAEEYRARRESDRKRDIRLIQPFIRLLRQQFDSHEIRVLDLGCGNGLNLSMFAEEGFRVTGIDISPRMLEVARETCPLAELIQGDFLEHSFPDACFNGVFAKAIIHLFPKTDAVTLLVKVHGILQPGGVFYVTTTVENQPFEGFREKSDYGVQVSRYRRTWTEEELTNALLNAGFRILETNYNQEEDRSKTWFNVWAVNSISQGQQIKQL